MVERNRDVIRTFIERHAAEGRRVAVVTVRGGHGRFVLLCEHVIGLAVRRNDHPV